jgi:hypothetical protein
MLAFGVSGSKTEVALEEREFSVVAVMFFGKRSVARFPTREQAEWRAKELNEQTERNPRGYIQYLVEPVEKTREDE